MRQQKQNSIEEHDLLMREEFEKQKYLVRTGMEVYGGSFAKSLGIALGCADDINSRKIKNTFPKEWQQYLKIGKSFIESEQAGED